MQQEIGQYIAELLYKHDRLSIPGFGSLELGHAPALLDQIQGQINAPAKEIKFKSDLVMDDGLLVNYLMDKKGWSLEQCQAWVNEQVVSLQNALEGREIVELSGLGRFFKNFENELQFVAENNNFNTNSFGLQPVMAHAVNHKVEERTTLKTTLGDQPKKEVKKDLNGGWLKKNLWWLTTLAILLISLSVFLIILQGRQNKPVADINVPVERLNTSPSKVLDEEAEDLEAENTLEPEEGSQLDNVPATEDEIDTEEPSVIPEGHTAIVAVGLFKSKDNVQKLLEQLTKDGFSPITEEEGEMTRVGVSIRFEKERELAKIHRELRRKYTDSAFIMFRDGVRVTNN